MAADPSADRQDRIQAARSVLELTQESEAEEDPPAIGFTGPEGADEEEDDGFEEVEPELRGK